MTKPSQTDCTLLKVAAQTRRLDPDPYGRRYELSRTLRAVTATFVVGASFLGTTQADASVKIAWGARSPNLRVSIIGAAEISWTQSGVRRHVKVAPTGAMRYGARLGLPNVAARTSAMRLPLKAKVWQTPDGTFWALQQWRRLRGRPVELRFSRWRGAPTKLTLRAVCCKWRSERIRGRASFQGRPIYGFSSTPAGVPLDRFGRNVYLDTFRQGRWKRMMGILTHRHDGTYSLWIRRYWRGKRYRGIISGPNWGWTLAPDARAHTRSVLSR